MHDITLQATAKAERRLQEAARKHEEDLLEAQEKRKLQDQVSLYLLVEQKGIIYDTHLCAVGHI
jgi:hypothetical protein